MQYPLTEKIGQPELLVGREKEYRQFQKWLDKIWGHIPSGCVDEASTGGAVFVGNSKVRF